SEVRGSMSLATNSSAQERSRTPMREKSRNATVPSARPSSWRSIKVRTAAPVRRVTRSQYGPATDSCSADLTSICVMPWLPSWLGHPLRNDDLQLRAGHRAQLLLARDVVLPLRIERDARRAAAHTELAVEPEHVTADALEAL